MCIIQQQKIRYSYQQRKTKFIHRQQFVEFPKFAITSANIQGILSLSRCTTTASGMLLNLESRSVSSQVSDDGELLLPTLQLIPEVFDKVNVRVLRQKALSLNLIITILSHGGLCSMTGGIVIWKETWVLPLKLP